MLLTVAKDRSLILANALFNLSKKNPIDFGSKYAIYKIVLGIEKPGSSIKIIFSKSDIINSRKSSLAFPSINEGAN